MLIAAHDVFFLVEVVAVHYIDLLQEVFVLLFEGHELGPYARLKGLLLKSKLKPRLFAFEKVAIYCLIQFC